MNALHFQERQQKYQFIMQNKHLYTVEKMCKALKISSNSYYKWRVRKPTTNFKTMQLKLLIKQIFHHNKRRYGAPKITKELEKQGLQYSVSYVSKLMKQMNLTSKIAKKFVVTTDSKHNFKVYKNLLNRNFKTTETGKVWVSDITYIKVKNKWNYLTTIIDLADRAVVGWTLSNKMTAVNTSIKAWKNAIQNRSIKNDFIFHSDRGVQYACNEFKNLFKYNHKITQSMSRKANCWDNAVAESFFKTLKYELINDIKLQSTQHAKQVLNQYINWYNTKRIHSSLEYKTPLEKYAEINNIKHKYVA